MATETYLNSAALHPVGTFAAKAIEQGLAYRLHGPGEGRAEFTADKQQNLKVQYAKLIGATANEIAFTSSTSDGENIVVMGLDLPKKKGNVVIDELHFTTSLYMYKELEKQGVELRIVKHRNWAIDPGDMDKAIDRNTRLVSLALVSNVNGFMHDCKAVSALAHSRGALVFADIIQAVGAVPLDVKALGIDFASAGTYKWLMGERGFGFLYVKEDLQGTVLPTTRYGHRQVSNFNRAELTWEPLPGAARYETGGIAVLLAACVSAGIDYVQALGIDKIRAHARVLTDRLQKELPPLGYTPLTPQGTETPTRRLRAEGWRRGQQDAAGQQGRRHGRWQREPAAVVGVGVQHPRRHRSRGGRAGRTRDLVGAVELDALTAAPRRRRCVRRAQASGRLRTLPFGPPAMDVDFL